MRHSLFGAVGRHLREILLDLVSLPVRPRNIRLPLGHMDPNHADSHCMFSRGRLNPVVRLETNGLQILRLHMSPSRKLSIIALFLLAFV